MPGNDLAWTHLREELGSILFGGVWQNDEWVDSAWEERAVSPKRTVKKRVDSLSGQFASFLEQCYFIQVVGVI